MRKLLSGGLAIFAGIVSLPAPGSLHAERTPPQSRRKNRHAARKIESIFRKVGLPGKGLFRRFHRRRRTLRPRLASTAEHFLSGIDRRQNG